MTDEATTAFRPLEPDAEPGVIVLRIVTRARPRTIVLGAALLAAAFALPPAAPIAAKSASGGPTQESHVLEAYSSNWAGYAVTGGRYTSVAATWTVPRVTPTSGRSGSAIWVGIDGALDDGLIQAGTEQDSTYGRVGYFAWWEILPAPAVRITAFTVRPGDRMTTSITRLSPGRWRITVRDARSGSFSTIRTYRGPATSAEWIEEAPVENGRQMPLAAIAPATFDLASVNGTLPGLTTDSRITLQRGATRATPSAPDSDGDGFTVRRATTPGPPPPS